MEHQGPMGVVLAWQAAVTRQDAKRLVELSNPNIEIVGPRGSGYGHELLQEWLARAGLSLEAQRVFARGKVVVVAQHAVWRNVETGDIVGEADIASRFLVDGQQVAQFARYDSLDVALAEAGLNTSDEIVQN